MEIFKENFSLKKYNTFGIDIKARFFGEFVSIEQLTESIKWCESNDLKWMILGSGANVLFGGDFSGAVLRSAMKGIQRKGTLVIAEGGCDWDELVEWSVAQGLGGIENLSYIPGTVGAAPIQNIGAYGVEAGDCIEWVEYLDTTTMELKRLSGSKCEFSYRESIFKRSLKGRAVIVRVAFALEEAPSEFKIDYGDVRELVEQKGLSLGSVREAIIEIRRGKLPEPSELGNAGSFFKNPVVGRADFERLSERFQDLRYYELEGEQYKIPAGWMIEKAGLKGTRDKDVGVHQKQALVLVNYGEATAGEIVAFAQGVISKVEQLFGVTLEMEVNLVV